MAKGPGENFVVTGIAQLPGKVTQEQREVGFESSVPMRLHRPHTDVKAVSCGPSPAFSAAVAIVRRNADRRQRPYRPPPQRAGVLATTANFLKVNG